MNPNNTIILTVPRSGSNLLENTLEAMGLFRLDKSHYCWDVAKRNIVTIARDPLETLTSYAAMRMHYRGGNIRKNIVAQYCSTYQYLIDNADIVLDYRDLVQDPYTVTGNLINALDKTVFFKTPEIRRNDDVKERRYLVSSTGSDYYGIAKELMQKEDLSECYELYDKLLSLKTKFDL
jgi:hypothetical protein